MDGYDLPHKPFMAARVGYAVDGPAFQVYGAFPDEHGIDFVCGDRRKARLFKLVGIPARQLAAQLYLLKLGSQRDVDGKLACLCQQAVAILLGLDANHHAGRVEGVEVKSARSDDVAVNGDQHHWKGRQGNDPIHHALMPCFQA